MTDMNKDIALDNGRTGHNGRCSWIVLWGVPCDTVLRLDCGWGKQYRKCDGWWWLDMAGDSHSFVDETEALVRVCVNM